MQISPATAPFELTQSRRKQCDNLEALHRLISTGDLAAQAQGARHIISIHGIPTYWSPSFAPGLSPYISTVLNGAQRLFLVDCAHRHVALYEGAREHWTRRVLTDRPELILSALPRRAMTPPSADAVASPRQLATLLKSLDQSRSQRESRVVHRLRFHEAGTPTVPAFLFSTVVNSTSQPSGRYRRPVPVAIMPLLFSPRRVLQNTLFPAPSS